VLKTRQNPKNEHEKAENVLKINDLPSNEHEIEENVSGIYTVFLYLEQIMLIPVRLCKSKLCRPLWPGI
jgi:hypothetical protein